MGSTTAFGDIAKVFVPSHRTTTANLQAIYPFMSAPGLGGRGTYIGHEVMGGSFCFDPWELYAQGKLTNPNMLVLGQVGRGKSSLVKTLLVRSLVFGRRSAILDPKGEYGSLAQVLNSPHIKVQPGGSVIVNPLDPGPGAAHLDADEIIRRQTTLLQSLLVASLNRDLTPEERTACDLALESLRNDTNGKGMTLPKVVGKLLSPTPEMAATVNTTVEQLAKASRDLALELRRMCEGDLRGMFDGETNIEVDWEGPTVVFDLSAVFSSSALGLLMTCATAWLQAAISRPNAGKRFIVVDEAWAVLANVGVARWLQQSYKLSRTYGTANVAIMHRVSDLQASGSAGSEAYNLAKGLLSDTETRIIYGQPVSEVKLATEMIGLTSAEAELMPLLRRGQALWKVGQSSHLVQHVLGAMESAIVDTDAGMTSTGNEPRLIDEPTPDIELKEQQDEYRSQAKFESFSPQINDLFAGDTERADAYIEAMTGQDQPEESTGIWGQSIEDLQEPSQDDEDPTIKKSKWGSGR
jgi:type IV secretory pathway VirB4 component